MVRLRVPKLKESYVRRDSWTRLNVFTFKSNAGKFFCSFVFLFFQAAVADTLSRKKIVQKTPHSVATYIVGPHNASRHP